MGASLGFLVAIPIITAATLKEVEKRQKRHLDWLRKNVIKESDEKCPLCGSPVLYWGEEARCKNCGARVERKPA